MNFESMEKSKPLLLFNLKVKNNTVMIRNLADKRGMIDVCVAEGYQSEQHRRPGMRIKEVSLR